MQRIRRLLMFIAPSVLLAVLVLSLHDQPADAQPAPSHPAHTHSGDCNAPGEIISPLSNVGLAFESEGVPMAGPFVGSDLAAPVELSISTIPASLAEVLGGQFAIVVHESADQIQNYIACGEIGGTLLGDTDLPIGLRELNDSGYLGTAWLHDNGDGTTTITITLNNYRAPADQERTAIGQRVNVSIEDFAFTPGLVNISVGDVIVFTNNDDTVHTVTQSPGGSGFQSGPIQPGATYELTIDGPGQFPFFCEFHPAMTGEISVT